MGRPEKAGAEEARVAKIPGLGDSTFETSRANERLAPPRQSSNPVTVEAQGRGEAVRKFKNFASAMLQPRECDHDDCGAAPDGAQALVDVYG